MIFVPLFLHDAWFYWAHRIEHRVPALWAFHRLHHSDALINTSTWARDHFLQNSWRAFFATFTLGMIVDLDLSEAGKAALYSTMFLSALSLFYHSAIHVRLPWLDRALVTPQVHRIHHSTDPQHYPLSDALRAAAARRAAGLVQALRRGLLDQDDRLRHRRLRRPPGLDP